MGGECFSVALIAKIAALCVSPSCSRSGKILSTCNPSTRSSQHSGRESASVDDMPSRPPSTEEGQMARLKRPRTYQHGKTKIQETVHQHAVEIIRQYGEYGSCPSSHRECLTISLDGVSSITEWQDKPMI